MLLAMMAQINPKETPDADRVYSLSFSDFGRLAGVNMHDNTYLEYLKDTVKSLEDRSFWSLDPASDGHQYKVLSWLQRGSTVNDRDKQIRVRFNRRSSLSFPAEKQLYLLQRGISADDEQHLLHAFLRNFAFLRQRRHRLRLHERPGVSAGHKEILDRFPDKAQDIRGFKYKVFDIQELKEQLSPRRKSEKGQGKAADRKVQQLPRF